ncbi:hypothetical protein DI392_00705 [Vibrio albus]|uniref:Uncharacterized protein n=1 Tax=Vibrio albus TaxID=2200953 RepID=A0A2U3BDM2_9VIBR|nr:hypothetical protein [Vibrio albus]PWI34834.1 hypothetical protein DI392_00705 [Vibrio albus]
MLIDISLMKGETPRLKPHLLSNETATLAKDCQFERGILAPVNDNAVSFSAPISPLSLFKYGTNWFFWETKVHAINNPMDQDVYDRVYWTGEDKPRVTAQDVALDINGNGPAAWYDLGVPAPASSPVVADIDTSTGEDPEEGELDSYDDEDRVYIQTYVTRFGEEGAPGDPSESVVVEKPGSTVTITLAQPGVNTHNITHTRLYRSVTSTTGRKYIMVAELPISQATYVDSERDASGASLETYDYDVPDENMQGLCLMANGICAGFAGNGVMFSEAYLPYAWPSDYRDTTEHEIMAIAAIGNSLAVATKGYPYIFDGVTPSAITGTKLPAEQACVSAESLVVISGMAFYASPDGLIALSSDGATNTTDQLITRDQWQAFNPETIKATSVEGKYIAQYAGGAFIFDPVSRDFIVISDSWDCAYNDLETDTLYVVIGSDVYQWRNGSNPLTFEWQSKEFLMPRNSVLNSARVQSPEPELVSVEFFADGELVMTVALGDLTDEAFRLPSVRASKWQIKVTGTAEVERILVASSMQELS